MYRTWNDCHRSPTAARSTPRTGAVEMRHNRFGYSDDNMSKKMASSDSVIGLNVNFKP